MGSYAPGPSQLESSSVNLRLSRMSLMRLLGRGARRGCGARARARRTREGERGLNEHGFEPGIGIGIGAQQRVLGGPHALWRSVAAQQHTHGRAGQLPSAPTGCQPLVLLFIPPTSVVAKDICPVLWLHLTGLARSLMRTRSEAMFKASAPVYSTL